MNTPTVAVAERNWTEELQPTSKIDRLLIQVLSRLDRNLQHSIVAASSARSAGRLALEGKRQAIHWRSMQSCLRVYHDLQRMRVKPPTPPDPADASALLPQVAPLRVIRGGRSSSSSNRPPSVQFDREAA